LKEVRKEDQRKAPMLQEKSGNDARYERDNVQMFIDHNKLLAFIRQQKRSGYKSPSRLKSTTLE
jgi:hypothetical protein